MSERVTQHEMEYFLLLFRGPIGYLTRKQAKREGLLIAKTNERQTNNEMAEQQESV